LQINPDEGLLLRPGPYLVTFNEIVNLPLDLMALAKPRSSLLRCGVAVHNAVWDAGYRGRSQALLVVYNPHGFTVYPKARLIQLVFFKLAKRPDRGYSGRFQSENL
jgi:dUTP pyrophosphatase